MDTSDIHFRRPWWLFSAHGETIFAAFKKSPVVDYERRIIKTPGNDEIALDYVTGSSFKPLVIIFHGLEGCSRSRTIRLLASGFIANHWTVAVPHFSSCGGHMNHLPQTYYAGDMTAIRWRINYCQSAFEHTHLFVIGVSLGGASLLHFLAKEKPSSPVAVATISTPYDLMQCVKSIDQGWNRILYARHFLKSLRAKVLEKSKRYPSIGDIKKIKAARTIGEFDELYTAPVHGFSSANEYWLRASPRRLLRDVDKPVLCINAENDPLIPMDTVPTSHKNPLITFSVPRHGGHGAFLGSPKGWLFDTVNQFFLNHIDR